MQEQLDLILQNVLFVGGYLKMLRELRAIHPRFIEECEQHEIELGEILEVVLAIRSATEGDSSIETAH